MEILDSNGYSWPWPRQTPEEVYAERVDAANRLRQRLEALPEFRFSPKQGHAPILRDWDRGWPIEFEDATPRGPMLPCKRNRLLKDGRWVLLGPRAKQTPGKADPVWDSGFNIKFEKRNVPAADAPLPQPHGTVEPAGETAELEWLTKTVCCYYHANYAQGEPPRDYNGNIIDPSPDHRGVVKELATEYATLKGAEVNVTSLDVAPEATDQEVEAEPSPQDDSDISSQYKEDDVNPRAMVVALPTPIFVTHPQTGKPVAVPAYGTHGYITAMKKRIEWEKFFYGCDEVERAWWELDKAGGLAVKLGTRVRDKDALKAMRHAFIDRWHEVFGSYPKPEEVPNRDAKKGIRSLDRLPKQQVKEYDVMVRNPDVDEDPERFGLKTEADYPEPRRWQYATGNHKHCRVVDNFVIHNGCTDDGDALFAADKEMYDAWFVKTQPYGYAGPRGALGMQDITKEDMDSNPFLRLEDELDENEWFESDEGFE